MVKRFLFIGILFSFCWGVLAIVPDGDLIFSHKSHAEMEFECITCHGSVEESESGTDNNLPEMDICMACHDGETASEECEYCHKDPDNAQTYPRVDIYHKMFAHKNHLVRDMTCSVCHYGVAEVDIATVAHLPTMRVCLACHQSDFTPRACEKCHEDFKQLKPEDHGYTWLSMHREKAKIDEQGCADCHTPDYCQSCHQAENLEGRTHDLNYMYNHSLDARGKQFDCASCHETRSFCSDCHREHMVMPISHSRVNWSNTIPGDGGRHKVEARQDLESCVACHDAGGSDPICADCHVK